MSLKTIAWKAKLHFTALKMPFKVGQGSGRNVSKCAKLLSQ